MDEHNLSDIPGLRDRGQLRHHRHGQPEEHRVRAGQAARGRQPRGVRANSRHSLRVQVSLGHPGQGPGDGASLAEDLRQVTRTRES